MSARNWYNSYKAKKKKEEEDIAPVFKADSNIKNNVHGGNGGSFGDGKDNKPTWFQAGAFSDGSKNFLDGAADLGKSILGTAADISENITTAVVDATENLIDTGAYVVGAVGGIFNEDFRDSVGDFIGKEILQPTKAGEVITKYANPAVGWLNQWINGGETEKNSLLGDKADSLVQSASHLVGSKALERVGVPSWLTMGVNAFGSEIESAFQQDATYLEAGISGAVSAVAEVAFEKLSSGIKFKGSTLDDGFQKTLTKNISDRITRTILKYVTDVGGEGLEEVATEAVSAVGKKLTYMDEKEFNEIFSSEDAFDAFIGGAVMSGTMGGGNIVKSATNGTDIASGLTVNEEKVVRKLYEDVLAEKQKEGTKLNKAERDKLWDSIVEDMSKGQIKVDDIESVLGGDTYKAYKDTAKRNADLKAELDKLSNMKKGDMTRVQEKRLEELEAMNLDDTTEISQLKHQLSNEVLDIVRSDKTGRLAESYREVARRKEAFKADLTKYKGKQREAVKRAIESGVLNNTYRSHELVNILSKIEADKGIVFNYTDNAKLKESGFAVEGKTVNGFVDNKTGAVTLNIQSAKSWQSVVGHETTHVLEGTDAYDALQKALYAYAESKGELANRRSAITELYKGMNADVDAELTADLIGDYLFTDKDFVTHLTTDRNLFQKIYDEIKYLYKVATGKEQKEIAKVKKEFDKAWKELNANPAESEQKNNTADSGVKYDVNLTFDNNDNITYDSLIEKDDMLISEVRSSLAYVKTLSREDVVEKARENLSHKKDSRGVIIIHNADTENDIAVGAPGLSHGLDRNFEYTAMVTLNLESYLENAIKINEAIADKNRKHDSDILLGYGETVTGEKIPAYFVVSKLTTGLDELVEFGSLYSIKAKKIAEDSTQGSPGVQSRTSATISISELLDIVNESYSDILPQSVAEHYGIKKRKTKLGKSVKFSLSPEADSEYLAAVESGDMEIAQRLVDKAAESAMKDSKIRDKSGKLVKVYHGSDSADFYEFDKQRRGQTDSSMYGRGYYFAFDSDYASDFGENIREFYVDIKKPYYIDVNAPASKIANFLKSKGIKVDFDYSNMKSHYFAKNFGSQKFSDTLVDLGFDGVIVRTDEGDYWETVAFHRNQMKLADAVTYDNDGNVIPISERFSEKRDMRYSLSNEADDNAPVGDFSTPLNDLYYDDFAPIRKDISLVKATNDTNAGGKQTVSKKEIIDAPIRDDIAPVVANNAIAAPIRDDLAPVKDGVNSKVFISMEEFANNDASLWNNVEHNDQATKSKIMRETHNAMIAEGAVIKVSDDTLKKVAESFPDLRTMKKKDRTQLLKDSMNKLKNNLRTFLSKFKGHSFEFEVNGKVLEARLYNTGINEVLEKVTQEKSSMLYSTEKIFQNSRYMYSTIDYDGDPNVYRWNYFYTPVQIGEGIVGVRIAVRDLAKQGESQIYHWGIKKDTSLDGVRDDSNNRKSYGVSSDVSNNIIPKDNEGVKEKTIQSPNNKAEGEEYSESSPEAVQAEIGNLETREKLMREGKPTTRQEHHNNIMDNVKSEFSRKGFDFDKVIKKAKNLSTFSTVDNTPQRVMEKALGYKEGQVLADLTVNKVAQNETEGIKWLNSFTDRKSGVLAQISKQYNIKPGSKESAAAQMYAEGFYVNKVNEIVKYGDAELAKDFPDIKVRDNIKGLAGDPRIRRIYDETLKAINESRTRNAYPEIQRLDNYFLHFRAMGDTFSRLGLPFNPNDIRAKDLPTDLNGVTADLKPGKPFFASEMHRTGKRTSFDLLGGLERYLTSAKNQIYHIDDIQTLRALRNYIADSYGQANGLEGLDALSEEEVQERIKQVYGSHLSTFAKFLNEEANVLAGKTALIDRGVEGIIGRKGLAFLDTVKRLFGGNTVGGNLSSPLTNFISVAQACAKSSKRDFTKAFAQTVSNKIKSLYGKGDNFTENSPVNIRRKGAERFYRTPYQKVGDVGFVLMSASDNISTELIARTKYNELTRKGMDSQQAHFETDKWVSRLMGDRSLGQQPQLYNSKMLGIFTQFQLEVRNQLDSMFYDTIQEAKVSNEHIENALARNAKTAAKVTYTFVQLAVVQHLFGIAFEAVAGYNPAFDIISVLATVFGFDDDEESEDTVLDNVEQGFLELLEDLPYTSTFTGGRVPISSALPIKQLVTGTDEYGNDKPRWETALEAAPYYALPTGYGQIKKTAQGLGMFKTDEEHPIAGSYTDKGKLRFPVEDTPANRIQAGLFGQYANENAREYFDNGYAPLNEKQIQEYEDVELPIADYWKYLGGLKGLKTNAEKANYINGLDIEDWQKNILMNNILDRKEDVDMSNYNDYNDLELFDFATKNPEKYKFMQENKFSYVEYKANEESREAYNWAFDNPEKYAVSKAVSDDVVTYRKYTKELSGIKADKDENGKSINGSKKEKVIEYINNLDIDYGSKLVLIKSQYPSENANNEEIVNYINNREDLGYEERVAIFKELGFEVSNDSVYWD